MKKILVVDDEDSIHLLYREEIILDINMPGMNGIDVLRKIKEMDSTMPVILSSAYQEFKQDLSTWASEDFIVKSADMSELIEAVIRHVRD